MNRREQQTRPSQRTRDAEAASSEAGASEERTVPQGTRAVRQFEEWPTMRGYSMQPDGLPRRAVARADPDARTEPALPAVERRRQKRTRTQTP